MKDHVNVFILLGMVCAVVFMLSSCATINCEDFKQTGDPEIDQAFYDKCREKKTKLINKGLDAMDDVEEKVVEGIEKI